MVDCGGTSVRANRPARVTEVVTTLKAAFSGRPFDYRGHTVQVTTPPRAADLP